MDYDLQRDDRAQDRLERPDATSRDSTQRKADDRGDSDGRRTGAIDRAGLTEAERRDRWPIG
jgi:hypothetical protein